MDEEYAKLSDVERLVANTLSASTPEWSSSVAVGDRHRRRVLYGEPALESVFSNAFAGASLVLRTTLQRMHEQRQGKKWPPDFAETKFNPPLIDIATDAEIMALDLQKASSIAASVRLDELFRIIPHLIMLDEGGDPEIKRSSVPASPESLNKDTGLPFTYHATRLRCPALYVAGAIPAVTQALPEIVVRAQNELLYGKFAATGGRDSRALLWTIPQEARSFFAELNRSRGERIR